MTNKSIAALLGLLCMGQSLFAQSTGTTGSTMASTNSYWDDSSKVSTKNLPQYNEFRNNQYPYPAKVRDMWQLGVTGGVMVPLFDVPNNSFPGWVAGLNIRKSLGYMVSVKIGAQYGEGKGQEFRPGTPIDNLPDPARTLYRQDGAIYLPNFDFKAIIPSAELMFSFKNILFNKGNPKSNVYLTLGYTPLVYSTTINALDANGQPYNFSGVDFYGSRKSVINQIKAILDNTYETQAISRARSQNFDNGTSKWQFRHSGFIGGGYEFRLSPRVTLGFEAKYYITGDDYLDGKFEQADQVQNSSTVAATSLTPSKDQFITGSFTFGFNIGSSAKRTEPKWFQNPLNYIYNEVNAPKHMKMPPVVLPDADGDGVTDQFDMEPNTPKGCAVDVHGVSLDTDGDGVPDCKDKEKLTPQSCFPVDADGVGKCPAPPCCDSLSNQMKAGGMNGAGACSLGSLPSVTFKGSSVTISKDAQALLASAAAQIQANPSCKVKVVGYGASSKSAQQLSWDRVNAVINYLVSKQSISENRFIFTYGQSGDANTVDLQGTTEEGPNTVPAPHPELKKSK